MELSENDIGVCVVTSSPQSYCSKVLKHFDWKGIKIVCYHDTSGHKPDPDPAVVVGISTYPEQTCSAYWLTGAML